MSGLLSIGARDVNVVALDPDQTDELRARTDAAYLMLRDLQVRTAVDPGSADGRSPADVGAKFDAKWCGDADPAPDPQERDGYCQSIPPTEKRSGCTRSTGSGFRRSGSGAAATISGAWPI